MKKHVKKLMQYTENINLKGLLFLFVFFFVFFFVLQQFIDVEIIQKFIEKHPFRSPFLLILIKAMTIIVAPLSGAVVYATAGVLFPFGKAFLYIVIGNIVGMTVAFYLGRWYGDKVIIFVFGEKGDKKAHHLLDRLGTWKSLGLARLILFPFGDLINYAAGLTKISYNDFLRVSILVTSLRILPWLFGIEKILQMIGV